MSTTAYRRAICAILSLAFLAGCGAPATTPAVPPANMLSISGPQGWPAGAKGKPILFIADLQGNVVRMYDPSKANPTAEGEITDGVDHPEGLAVDSKGSLYVSNVGYSGKESIDVYSAGSSKPRLIIHGPGYYGLAVDSKGDIFATEVAGYVDAYKPGAKSRYERITGFSNPSGIAIDSKNNVWVADETQVDIIPAGAKTFKNAKLQDINSPVGLAFGSGDELYVANFGPYDVAVYKSGSTRPEYTITDGITGPTLNGVTAANIFFQSNQLNNVVGYKKGQKAVWSTIVGNSDPLGIASSPEVKK